MRSICSAPSLPLTRFLFAHIYISHKDGPIVRDGHGQGMDWVYPIPYPKSFPMDIQLSIPISIHTRILPKYIIRGYPYPTRKPFNFFF